MKRLDLRQPYNITLDCDHEYIMYYPSKPPRRLMGVLAFCSSCGKSRAIVEVTEFKLEQTESTQTSSTL